jgi:hypothetical protein
MVLRLYRRLLQSCFMRLRTSTRMIHFDHISIFLEKFFASHIMLQATFT